MCVLWSDMVRYDQQEGCVTMLLRTSSLLLGYLSSGNRRNIHFCLFQEDLVVHGLLNSVEVCVVPLLSMTEAHHARLVTLVQSRKA